MFSVKPIISRPESPVMRGARARFRLLQGHRGAVGQPLFSQSSRNRVERGRTLMRLTATGVPSGSFPLKQWAKPPLPRSVEKPSVAASSSAYSRQRQAVAMMR